jgi:hypothetical protein
MRMYIHITALVIEHCIYRIAVADGVVLFFATIPQVFIYSRLKFNHVKEVHENTFEHYYKRF